MSETPLPAVCADTRPSVARRLLAIAEAVTPFAALTGQPCAAVSVGTSGYEIWPIRGARLRQWLLASYVSRYGESPSRQALSAAIETLEALALHNPDPARPVALRIAATGNPFHPSSLLLDLANSAGHTLAIDAAGFSLLPQPSPLFRRSPSTIALPTPIENPGPSGLNRLLPLPAACLARIHFWLTAALRPVGPYPILVLTGPSGSGKSLAANLLRSILDPSLDPVRTLPSRPNALLDLAWQNRILAFDAIARLSPSISAALSALSSGTSVNIPHSASPREPLASSIARPIILAVPPSVAAKLDPHLAARALLVRFPELSPSRRRTEAALHAAFAELHPALLGAICRAASTALRNLASIHLAELPRLADFAVFSAAAAPAFGLTLSDVLAAAAPPPTPSLASAVQDLLTGLAAPWHGRATDLLTQLRRYCPPHLLPASPRSLSEALAALPSVQLHRTRTPGERTLTLTLPTPAQTPVRLPPVTAGGSASSH
jgi:energy-coupling factor transporter ATP-binding protein EcfA2